MDENGFSGIVLLSLDWNSSLQQSKIMCMEVFGDEPIGFYMAHLPILDYKYNNKFPYYQNILNQNNIHFQNKSEYAKYLKYNS